MVIFTVGQVEVLHLFYGMLQGPFGVRVFFNQPAGFKAVDQVKGFLLAGEEEHLKSKIQASKNLPARGWSPEMEELVGEALPPRYVM